MISKDPLGNPTGTIRGILALAFSLAGATYVIVDAIAQYQGHAHLRIDPAVAAVGTAVVFNYLGLRTSQAISSAKAAFLSIPPVEQEPAATVPVVQMPGSDAEQLQAA